MAVEIQLPERRAIGPTRVGRAEPGFDLAGGVGLQEIGEAVTELAMFTGKHFDDIRKAKDVNEKADALAAFSTLNESFDTFVAENPNASPDQLLTKWGETETEIKKIAAQIGTRPKSVEDINNVLARNMLLAGQRAHTTAAAIGLAQQKARFNVNTERAIRDIDPTELKSLYDSIELFTPENNKANFENDMSRLLERKAIEDASNAREAAALAAKAERLAKTAAKEKADIEFQEEYDDLTNMALGIPESPVIEPTIATQEEYDALPSGSYYTDANGNRGRKR